VVQLFLELARLHVHVLLHEIVAHGYQTHAQQQIHKVDDELGLAALGGVAGTPAWDQIAHADLAERRDAEVSTVQEVPALPLGEHDRAGEDIAEDHPEAGGRWHGDPLTGFPLAGALV